jgi:hypothetical protein
LNRGSLKLLVYHKNRGSWVQFRARVNPPKVSGFDNIFNVDTYALMYIQYLIFVAKGSVD